MLKKSGSRVSFSARSRKDISGDEKISLSKEHSINSSNKSSSNINKNVQRMQSAKLPSISQGSQSQSNLASINSKNAENQNMANAQSAKRSKIPQYLREMNILEKKQNEKIIKNMNKRINFMRNPRYEIIRPPIQCTDIQSKPDLLIDSQSSSSLFRAVPSYLLFQNYLINEVYEINLKIVNVSRISRRIKFLPPSRVLYPGEIASKYEMLRTDGFYEDVNKEKGMIAPGMSLNLNIKFFATSFSEFRDEITFISEENIFKVPIIAQKEAPLISLPEILDCQSCWLGDRADMVFRIQNKGGEAGFKFFCEDQNDDHKQNGETLQTDSFTLYPCEFYIQKNEVVEIFVTFTPKKEGVTKEKIILACDNLTSAVYTLQGTGNMAELGIHGIDQVILSEIPEVNKLDPQTVLKKIFFNDASPGTVISRYITIQNKASVRVKYHWSISKTDMRASKFEIGKPEDYYFSIEPNDGYFEKNEIKKFKVSFNSRDPVPIYEYANLIIDDISIESIRNPPESIKRMKDIPQILVFEEKPDEENFEEMALRGGAEPEDFIQKGSKQLHIGRQIIKPGFVGSNTDRPSLTYFEFELIGLSTYSKVTIDPPFQVIPGELFIGKYYYKEFNIVNLSDSEINYDISVCEQYLSLPSIMGDIKDKNGILAPRSTKPIIVGFTSKATGSNKSITFRVNFDKAHSQVMELVGDFVGPNVQFSIPMVDFGLFKAGDVGKYKFELRNNSDVEAEVLFRESTEDGSFEDHRETILKRLANEKLNGNVSFLYYRDENEKFYKKAIERVAFEPPFATIPPKSKIEVEVKCGCEDAISIYRIVECLVKNGNSIFLELFAEIQKIHVTLNRFLMKTETLYACNEYNFSKGKTPLFVELQNLGNIPCAFEWETEADEKVEKRENIKYNFIPTKGVIPPKSKLPIRFELQPLDGGKLNELFVVNCQGIEFPLGFEIQSEVLGLSVEYDLIENTNESLNPNLSSLEATSRALAVKHNIKSLISEHKEKTQVKNQKLEAIEFYDCKINKPKTLKICIRNTSGVNTNFEIFPQKYLPYMNDEVKSPTSMVMPNSIAEDLSMISGLQSINQTGKFSPMNFDENNQMKAIRFSQSINSVPSQIVKRDSQIRINRKSLKPLPPRPVVLLTDDIEKKNNFTSSSGQALNQTKRLDKDQRIYLANNKGIAILCEPNRGKLKPHSEVIVKVSCFNDICGTFKDQLVIDVKGLPLQKFPMVVEVKGSPVIVLPNQLGMSYKGDWPCYNFGTYMRNITTVKREFKIQNSGPKDITMDWKLFNLDEKSEGNDYFNIKIEDPHLGSDNVCQLKFDPVEPKQAEKSPFTILEKTITIEGRQDKSIQIEYNSQIDANYNYVMVGKPRLVNPRESQSIISQYDETKPEDHPHLNMGTIAVYLKSTSIQPQLYFDKLKNVEGSHKLKFAKWALSENKKGQKEICLVNLLQSNLLFNIQVVGPFKLVHSITNSPAKYDQSKTVKLLNKDKLEIETKFNLVQNSNVKLLLDFQGPSITDQQEWPLTYKVYKYGVLHFNFINGDSQTIELEGQLLRPQLQLNTSGTENVSGTDIQDFGTVHINNFKTVVIFLSNLSKVPANWKLSHLKNVPKRGGSALPIPQNTMTKQEIEDSLRTDDPSVFEFQLTEGTLLGPSIPVRSFPDTLALPTKKINTILHQQQLYPQKIYINFRPKMNILYKSKFRITVQEGPYLDFTLKGYGTYEESKFK